MWFLIGVLDICFNLKLDKNKIALKIFKSDQIKIQWLLIPVYRIYKTEKYEKMANFRWISENKMPRT